MVVIYVEYGKILSQTPWEYNDTKNHLFLLSKGDAQFTIQGKCTVKGPGQMLYVLPGQTLCLCSLQKHTAIDLILFQLSDEEKESFHKLSLPILEPSAPVNFPELTAIARNIYHLFYSADRYRDEKLDCQLKNLIYCTASGDEEFDIQTHKKELYYHFRRLRTLVSDNPTHFKNVAEAARYVGLSVSHFEHMYQKYFSMNYQSDLIRSRVKRASMLLVSTDWTVAKIAIEVGYQNESFFYRQFKQQTGVSPAAYRKLATWMP